MARDGTITRKPISGKGIREWFIFAWGMDGRFPIRKGSEICTARFLETKAYSGRRRGDTATGLVQGRSMPLILKDGCKVSVTKGETRIPTFIMEKGS